MVLSRRMHHCQKAVLSKFCLPATAKVPQLRSTKRLYRLGSRVVQSVFLPLTGGVFEIYPGDLAHHYTSQIYQVSVT